MLINVACMAHKAVIAADALSVAMLTEKDVRLTRDGAP